MMIPNKKDRRKKIIKKDKTRLGETQEMEV